MKRLIPFVLLLLPAALFAQSFKEQDTAMLKKLGLNDSQVSQVLDIQGKTRAAVRQDAVQIWLLRAQMEKVLLPANPNMQDVNGYFTQISATRADLMKTFVGRAFSSARSSGMTISPPTRALSCTATAWSAAAAPSRCIVPLRGAWGPGAQWAATAP